MHVTCLVTCIVTEDVPLPYLKHIPCTVSDICEDYLGNYSTEDLAPKPA